MTLTNVPPAGTVNDHVPVGFGLLPISAAQFWHIFAGLKLPRYDPPKMKFVPVQAVLMVAVTHIGAPVVLTDVYAS